MTEACWARVRCMKIKYITWWVMVDIGWSHWENKIPEAEQQVRRPTQTIDKLTEAWFPRDVVSQASCPCGVRRDAREVTSRSALSLSTVWVGELGG